MDKLFPCESTNWLRILQIRFLPFNFSSTVGFFTASFFILGAKNALAVCPVCTVAVGGGIELSRMLGVDDSVTGIWIGGLIVSASMWTLDWMKRKGYDFKGMNWAIPAVYYILSIAPLRYYGYILQGNNLFGLDKILLSAALGSLSFFAGGQAYEFLKAKNEGKAHFPFEKVAMPIAPLVVLSIIFYFITK